MQAMMGTDNESPSSSRDEHGEIPVERVNSIRHEDIAIQVENDIARLEKICEDDESMILIPRVPKVIRQGANGAYDPQVVSIGPYHWGKPRFAATEKLKVRYLMEFRDRLPGRCLGNYINEIESLEPQLRSCYYKDIDKSSKNFVEMVLIDGCFLVEVLLQVWYDETPKTWLFELILYDMLLLENQLPFFLLQRIYDIYDITSTKENQARPSSFKQVAVEFVRRLVDLKFVTHEQSIESKYRPPERIHHFLHLYHSFYTSFCSQRLSGTYSDESSCPTTSGMKLDFCIIPNATELHHLVIKFKIIESHNPFHIRYHRGDMEISPLKLSNAKANRLLNIIAFERYNFEVEPCFTAYLKIIDLLVNTSNDVALLRRYGIIHHEIGSDEEVAIFFSQLTKGIVNYETRSSRKMYKEVNKYCNVRRHRWRASLIRDYCRSPWSTLSLVAAFILLVLTFVQSYMSLQSYYRPPHS